MRVENRKRYERMRSLSEGRLQKTQLTLRALHSQCSEAQKSLQKYERKFQQIVTRLNKISDLQQKPAGVLLQARTAFAELPDLKLRCEQFREKEAVLTKARSMAMQDVRMADRSVQKINASINALDRAVEEVLAEKQEEELVALAVAENNLQREFDIGCGLLSDPAPSIGNGGAETAHEGREAAGSHTSSSAEFTAVSTPRNEARAGRMLPSTALNQLVAIDGISNIAFAKSEVVFDYRTTSGDVLSVYLHYTGEGVLHVSIIAAELTSTRRTAVARELLHALRSHGFPNVTIQLSGRDLP